MAFDLIFFQFIMDKMQSFSVKSFYLIRGALNRIQENTVPEGVDVIDITQVPPLVDEMIDEEDFDNKVIDDNYTDPTFIPPKVSGTVDLHQFGEETAEKSE